jgi:yecA family protein
MLDNALTELERKELARTLERTAQDGGLTFSELDGLVCCLAIGPNMIPPSAWLPLVWGEEGSGFDSIADAQRGYSLVLRHYNAVGAAIRDGTYEPTYVTKIRGDEQSRAQQWATGFVAGMSLDPEWKDLLADPHECKALYPILILADARMMVQKYERDPEGSETFISLVPMVLPIVQSYWRTRESAPKRRAAPASSRTRAPKREPKKRQARPATGTIHRLKIQLREVKPAVWRRVEISSDAKLPALSRALLAAMGWTDTHLHAFRIGRDQFGTKDDDWSDDTHDERRYTVADLLPRAGDYLDYDYDFGDGWSHRVTVEAIVPPDATARYPRCTAGRRACPPEDCGGPYGYENFLRAIADPRHPEHEELMEWGGPFDPGAFDLEETNRGINAHFRRSRKKGS